MPATLVDQMVVPITTDSQGRAFLAINLNGAPGHDDVTGMVLYGNPGTPLLETPRFRKFKSGKVNHIWEQVRTVWCSVKIIPLLPNFLTTFPPVYVIKERDGCDWNPSSYSPSAEELLADMSTKTYNSYKQFRIFQRCVGYGMLNKVPPYPTSLVSANTGANIHGQWRGCDENLGSLDATNSAHIYAMWRGAEASKVIAYGIIKAKFQVKGTYDAGD